LNPVEQIQGSEPVRAEKQFENIAQRVDWRRLMS
jgi:hypothetical protein